MSLQEAVILVQHNVNIRRHVSITDDNARRQLHVFIHRILPQFSVEGDVLSLTVIETHVQLRSRFGALDKSCVSNGGGEEAAEEVETD